MNSNARELRGDVEDVCRRNAYQVLMRRELEVDSESGNPARQTESAGRGGVSTLLTALGSLPPAAPI